MLCTMGMGFLVCILAQHLWQTTADWKTKRTCTQLKLSSFTFSMGKKCNFLTEHLSRDFNLQWAHVYHKSAFSYIIKKSTTYSCVLCVLTNTYKSLDHKTLMSFLLLLLLYAIFHMPVRLFKVHSIFSHKKPSHTYENTTAYINKHTHTQFK